MFTLQPHGGRLAPPMACVAVPIPITFPPLSFEQILTERYQHLFYLKRCTLSNIYVVVNDAQMYVDCMSQTSRSIFVSCFSCMIRWLFVRLPGLPCVHQVRQSKKYIKHLLKVFYLIKTFNG